MLTELEMLDVSSFILQIEPDDAPEIIRSAMGFVIRKSSHSPYKLARAQSGHRHYRKDACGIR